MAEPRHWYLVMYDVSDPKALRQVHDLLTGWGSPLQYSVFRVRATVREQARLRFEVLNLLQPDDRLAIVRLCDGCATRVSVRGRPLAEFTDPADPCFIV